MDARVAIVTGGTFGIGAAISVDLARRGWRVVAFGLDAPQLSSVAQDGSRTLRTELRAQGLEADVMEADVSKATDVQRIVDHAMGRYARIDALVNNAAIGPLGGVLQTAEDVWDRVIDVNLKGAYLCCKAALPHMIARGGGAIVNVGSGAGWGKPNMAAYSASKGGLLALGMALAYDHFQDRIRVNTVVPGGGGIVTGMSLGRLGGDPTRLDPTRLDPTRLDPTRLAARKPAGTVAGRSTTPQDVANAVAFLLSDEAAVISGTVLDVGCFAHQGGRA
jgi:NAD(P)-dependent dehydrogenase (short-subunit alcohol dehydrogenase family)